MCRITWRRERPGVQQEGRPAARRRPDDPEPRDGARRLRLQSVTDPARDPRPDPDALLARVQEEQRRRAARKAQGSSSARRRRRQDLRDAGGGARAAARAGVDVVIGWVETHGRAETEALLPGSSGCRRARSSTAAPRSASSISTPRWRAARRSSCVDELAHTNAPGSRHAKRWQDVTELLDAGIDVYTTLNVQHLESLNDVVARVTGVPTRETVPDSILERGRRGRAGGPAARRPASARLKDGKVYVPEQAGEAVAQLLPQGQPDRAARAGAADDGGARRRPDGGLSARPRRAGRPGRWPSASWSASARARSPRALVRAAPAAWRPGCAPSGSSCNVETLGRRALSRARTATASLQTLRLAEQLGAETVTADGPRHAARRCSRTRAAATSRASCWASRRAPGWRGGSVRLGRQRARAAERRHRRLRHHRRAQRARPSRARAAGAAPSTGAATRRPLSVVVALHARRVGSCSAASTPANLIMVYLLGTVLAAWRLGRGPVDPRRPSSAWLRSTSSSSRPYLTFAVSDTQYLVTFAVMLARGDSDQHAHRARPGPGGRPRASAERAHRGASTR